MSQVSALYNSNCLATSNPSITNNVKYHKQKRSKSQNKAFKGNRGRFLRPKVMEFNGFGILCPNRNKKIKKRGHKQKLKKLAKNQLKNFPYIVDKNS
jgi:hypothetical protein